MKGAIKHTSADKIHAEDKRSMIADVVVDDIAP